MSTVHDRLKAVEGLLERRGARFYTDAAVDDMLDDTAEGNLRAETDRLAQLAQLEVEQNHVTTRRGWAERQPRLF